MKHSHCYSYCRVCHRWIPVEFMQYYTDEETGKFCKACQWCMEGEPSPEEFVLDIEAGYNRCVYCDSTNTQIHDWRKGSFRCNDCNELFYIIR